MLNDHYFHMSDNQVLYYIRTPAAQNGSNYKYVIYLSSINYFSKFCRFEETQPTQFHIGDIVEIQTTVIAVPVKERRFKMILQLRSLALINSSFTQVCSSCHYYNIK